MPIFELEGYSKKTKRKRIRSYRVANTDEAIERACADDLIVDTSTIRRVYPVKHTFTKVVGVTKKNANNSDRQKIIARCRMGQALGVQHEATNQYSRHAVMVGTERGEQLGYLPDDVAFDVVREMHEGCAHLCYIAGIGLVERSDEGDQVYGVALLLIMAGDPQTGTAIVRNYVQTELSSEPVTSFVLKQLRD
ncbi:MAG TPA: HIRAN domain-containing protein [Tepidisphaeraceae bacterium]|nr:HIRAN domain-containing protein [Tepidisphaeraceae bacterium]